MLRLFIHLANAGLLAGSLGIRAADLNDAPKEFDHNFLGKVPHHHRGAVDMANLCQQRRSTRMNEWGAMGGASHEQ